MYSGQIRVRFGDIDQAGIVYYPRFFNYFHMVYEDYLRERVIPLHAILKERKIGFPIVHLEADFRAPLRYGDVCPVELELLKLGGSSLTYRYRIYKVTPCIGGDGEKQGSGDSREAAGAAPGRILCAEAKIVTACMDITAGAGTLIPADIRALLAQELVTPTA